LSNIHVYRKFLFDNKRIVYDSRHNDTSAISPRLRRKAACWRSNSVTRLLWLRGGTVSNTRHASLDPFTKYSTYSKSVRTMFVVLKLGYTTGINLLPFLFHIIDSSVLITIFVHIYYWRECQQSQ